MKITIVLGPFYPLPPDGCGAVERVWHALSHSIFEAGHDVVLIGKGPSRLTSASPCGRHKIVALRGYQATGNIWLDLLKDFLYGLQVLTHLGACDVIVANSFWLPVVCRLNMRRTARIMVHVARFPKHQMWLYGNASVVQAISRAVEHEVVRQCPKLRDKVVTLPYPIDRSVFAPPARARDYSGALTVLYAGRVHPEKGVHLLIEAIRKVALAHPLVKLRVIGPCSVEMGGGGPSYANHLRELARGVPVEFVPTANDPRDLAVEYQCAHFFCYPSLAEKGEAFGLAALEAMATGLPVVVSHLECFKDFIDDGVDGLVFDHRTPAPATALAGVLDRLLGDTTLAMQLGERAAVKAEGYAYDTVARRYVALVESLHAEPAPRRRGRPRPGMPGI